MFWSLTNFWPPPPSRSSWVQQHTIHTTQFYPQSEFLTYCRVGACFFHICFSSMHASSIFVSLQLFKPQKCAICEHKDTFNWPKSNWRWNRANSGTTRSPLSRSPQTSSKKWPFSKRGGTWSGDIYIFTWKNEGTVFRKSGLKYVAGQRFIYTKI